LFFGVVVVLDDDPAWGRPSFFVSWDLPSFFGFLNWGLPCFFSVYFLARDCPSAFFSLNVFLLMIAKICL